MPFNTPPDLIRRQPDRPHNPLIQRLASHMRAQLTAKSKAQIGDVLFPTWLSRIGSLKTRHVHAHHLSRREVKSSFFQRFARAGLRQAFAWVQVARRVIEFQAVAGFFFDQKEFLDAVKVFVDNCGDCHAGSESSFHGG